MFTDDNKTKKQRERITLNYNLEKENVSYWYVSSHGIASHAHGRENYFWSGLENGSSQRQNKLTCLTKDNCCLSGKVVKSN